MMGMELDSQLRIQTMLTIWIPIMSLIMNEDTIPTMTNEQVIIALYDIELGAQQQQQEEEVYRWQSMYQTYKRPTETQYAYLVSSSSLYRTHYSITSDHIRVCQWAYNFAKRWFDCFLMVDILLIFPPFWKCMRFNSWNDQNQLTYNF